MNAVQEAIKLLEKRKEELKSELASIEEALNSLNKKSDSGVQETIITYESIKEKISRGMKESYQKRRAEVLSMLQEELEKNKGKTYETLREKMPDNRKNLVKDVLERNPEIFEWKAGLWFLK